jgi:hypothetical protein
MFAALHFKSLMMLVIIMWNSAINGSDNYVQCSVNKTPST